MTPSQFAAIYNQKRVPGYYTQSGGAGNVPVFTSNPSILSTPTVGSPTAYLSGTYTGTPPITVTQQWNLNGTPVGGATYTPVSGDVGKTLTVVEAIQNAYGGPVYATSAGATVVAAGTNPNPIGTNFAAGGSASLSYEGFPIFQDRIREALMFSAVTIPSANITANGTTSITLYNIQGTCHWI